MGVMRTGADVVRVKEGGEPASRAAGQQHLLGAVQPVLRTRGCELSEGSSSSQHPASSQPAEGLTDATRVCSSASSTLLPRK